MTQYSLRAGKETEPGIEYAAQADRFSPSGQGNQRKSKRKKRRKRKKLGDAGNRKETSHRRAARRVASQTGSVIHKQRTGMHPVSFMEHNGHPGDGSRLVLVGLDEMIARCVISADFDGINLHRYPVHL
jgi:hypothetical protein